MLPSSSGVRTCSLILASDLSQYFFKYFGDNVSWLPICGPCSVGGAEGSLIPSTTLLVSKDKKKSWTWSTVILNLKYVTKSVALSTF